MIIITWYDMSLEEPKLITMFLKEGHIIEFCHRRFLLRVWLTMARVFVILYIFFFFYFSISFFNIWSWLCPQSKSLGDKGKQKKHVMLHGMNVVPVTFKKFLCPKKVYVFTTCESESTHEMSFFLTLSLPWGTNTFILASIIRLSRKKSDEKLQHWNLRNKALDTCILKNLA